MILTSLEETKILGSKVLVWLETFSRVGGKKEPEHSGASAREARRTHGPAMVVETGTATNETGYHEKRKTGPRNWVWMR
jgi:hypothetical protein